MDYAFDTNTIIHLMRGTDSVVECREKANKQGASFAIPLFVHYEIKRGLIIKPIPEHITAYGIICENCLVGEMTAEVWEQAANIYAELYAKRFTVRDSDILIAAYCIVYGYTLVTANVKDFENMEGLLIEDWTKSVGD